jgi:hypothetical protein
MANQNKLEIKRLYRERQVWALLAVACGLAAWVVVHNQSDSVPSSKIDPFSGPLVIDAPGCEISGPDGKSIKDDIRGVAQLVIPKGTSFNGDCFPAAKAAREADYHNKGTSQ